MKNISKKVLALTLSAIIAAGFFQACGGSDNNEEITELQRQLDSTMQKYHRLKAESGDFEHQLSSRDSAITAQAAEIQDLINQLDAAKRRQLTSSNTTQTASGDNKATIDRQQKEIREKENTIRQLQKQIDQQTKQIAELKKQGQSAPQGNSDQQKQLTKLQSQIKEQQSQIASLQSDIQRLRDENSAATKNSNKMKKDYESQLSTVNSQLSACRSDLENLTAQVNAKDEEIKRLNNNASHPDESAELKQLRLQINDLTNREAACQKKYDEVVAQMNNSKDQSSNCETDKQSLQKEINDLNKQVANLQKRVENLQNQNAELTRNIGQGSDSECTLYLKTINDLNAEIESQRNQISQLNSDLKQKDLELEAAKKNSGKKADAATVNQKLQELQEMCDSYLAEIERLRAENELLKSENAELKDRVASSANLFAENERLQQKVKLASVLVTTDLKVTPGKSIKTGNVVNSTDKAKKVSVIRIDCRILDNNVIDPGSITIYARIADASNRVIANGQPESFDMSGVQMQYTMKQDIEFTGYGRNLAMIWKKAENVELAPGLYWMTLYAGGYEIGKVSFKLN